MKVHEVMSTKVESVTVTTPLRDLWKAIFKNHIHSLPVVDTNKKVIGMIVEEDLLKPLYPDFAHMIDDFIGAAEFEEMEEQIHTLVKLKAEHVMNKKVIFTRGDTPVMRALSRMIVQKVHQLPVLSDDGILLGMVSKGDIFDNLFKKHLRIKGFVRHKRTTLRHHIASNKGNIRKK